MTEDNGVRVSSGEPIAVPNADSSSQTKPRRKRKWDQPAESFLSTGNAVPVALPSCNMTPLGGVAAASVAALVPVSSVKCATSTQSKIQDELIAREISINDADPSVRYKLTKRQTQEEIQRQTGAVVITRGKYHPPNTPPDGNKFPCWALSDLSSFRHKFGEDAYNKLDVIGIDEAQFFDDLYDFCCNVADKDGKIVVVAGLDGDYLRRRFGSVLDVVPLADTVTKLTARCEVCGKKANFTLRKTEETRTELIAGADVYMPVCRRHYANGQDVIQSSKNVLGSRTILRSASNLI